MIGTVTPNVVDLAAERATFTWEAARRRLDGLPGGRGLNIAHEAVDRHAAGPRRDHVAIRWIRRDGTVEEATYGQLAERTSRFANALRALGVGPGDAVFTLLGRVPEMDVAAIGTLRNRSVLCPLFAAFGPEPIHQRLARGGGKVLVTTAALYARKVAPGRDRLPDLEHVLLVGPTTGAATTTTATVDAPGVHALDDLLAAASPDHVIAATDPEEVALLHFTSGTTGMPKGAVHVHAAVVAHHETGRSALDLHPDDVFWCTADPGWVTGTSYGIIAPLTHGVTSVVDEADFEAGRWYRLLEEQGVTVWYTAPTAIRMLMRAGDDLPRAHDLSRLRLVTSVGEPLDAAAVTWGESVLGRPVRDTWWQTETGGIMIANLASSPVRPGSMGEPLPGVEAAVLACGPDGRAEVRDGRVRPLDEPDAVGELALRPGWPSMFRGYLHDEERYARCFAGGWYLTGDLARRDAEGAYWFVGRADDVITSAGHEPGDALRRELLGRARTRLGPAVAPRQIAFDQDLPRTRSGKVVRRLLKARELGLPEGDTSALEASA